MWFAPSDGRAFTNYAPACRTNAAFAKSLNVTTNAEYIAALKQKGMLRHIKQQIKPRPGSYLTEQRPMPASSLGPNPPSNITSGSRR